jgi:hypothetical protein
MLLVSERGGFIMQKKVIWVVFLVLGMLNPFSIGVYIAKAELGISTNVEITEGTNPTFVNQPVVLTVSTSGGTPPYAIQWYVEGSSVFGATQPTFSFVESTPGLYHISVSVYDSKGVGGIPLMLQAEGGIGVFVKAFPTPSLTSSPPSISFQAKENKTYTTNNIPLNFTLSKSAQWIGYSLDGQANITTSENITLIGLSNGQHNVTIYANDTFGNNAPPQTITFSINKPSTFPITEAVTTAAIVSVIVVVGGVVVYVLKVKPKRVKAQERE